MAKDICPFCKKGTLKKTILNDYHHGSILGVPRVITSGGNYKYSCTKCEEGKGTMFQGLGTMIDLSLCMHACSPFRIPWDVANSMRRSLGKPVDEAQELYGLDFSKENPLQLEGEKLLRIHIINNMLDDNMVSKTNDMEEINNVIHINGKPKKIYVELKYTNKWKFVCYRNLKKEIIK